MKRIIIAGLLALLSISGAHAQCSGIQPAGSLCGNRAATGAPAAPTRTPVLGLAGTALGTLGLSGNTSGVVTLRTGAAAGTYNFVLPASAGTAGQLLTSGGGGTTAMTYTSTGTSGHTLPFLDGINTWSALNTFTGLIANTATLASTTSAFEQIITFSGTGFRFGNYTNIIDNTTVTGSGLHIDYSAGGATWQGEKAAGRFSAFQNTVPGGSSNPTLIGIQASVQGGAGITGTSAYLTGAYVTATIQAGNTSVANLLGSETNVACAATSSCNARIGWLIASAPAGDLTSRQGATTDVAYGVSAYIGSAPFKCLFCTIQATGAFPGDNTTTFIGTLVAGTVNYGVDFNSLTCVTACWRSPNATLTNAGVWTLVGVNISTIITATEVAAPSTPAAGFGAIWFSSAAKRIHDIDDLGNVGTTVISNAGSANNFVTRINTAGGIVTAQPSFANISGTCTPAQGCLGGLIAVGSLPTCNGAAEGIRYGVTDSNAASFTAGIGAVVAAGGATHVPVYCDGTNWRIG